jgi:hypothetical protein
MIAEQPDSMSIGPIRIGAPTCADDTCILTTDHLGAQTALLLAQDHAAKDRYEFSTTKTKVLHFNPKRLQSKKGRETPTPLLFNDSPLEFTKQETHLGIEKSEDGKTTATVLSRIKKARRMSYSMMGAGMHGLNGVSATVAMAMVNTYIIPALMYGLETLRLSTGDYRELSQYHLNLLRNILHLPRTTATPAVYLLTGALPTEALHHKNILTFFGNCLRRDNSIEKQIIIRQLAMKEMNSSSWIILVRELLYKYQLPSAFKLASNPPSKPRWNKMVKKAVEENWLCKLRRQCSEMSTLQHLNAHSCNFGRVHQVYDYADCPREIMMSSTKARMLIQRYGVSGSYTSGKMKSEKCPLCKTEEETLSHIYASAL